MSQPRPTIDQFGRYTDRAQSVMARAHGHAQRLRQTSIDTEHLLLAITDAGEGTAAMALAALNISLVAIRRETTSQASSGQTTPGKSIRMSAAASAVLDRAEREADTLGHHYVGTDHLLLALATQTGSLAALVLAGLSLSDDRLRAVVRDLLNAYPQGRRTGEEPTPERVVAGRRFALPAAHGSYNEDIGEARWQKELAIDAEHFEAAAAWRTEEKRLRAGKRDLINNWAAGIDTVALVDEIDRLYRQADRLRDLLHEHGITAGEPTDPGKGNGRRERRPPKPIPASDRSVTNRSVDTPADHATVGKHAPSVAATAEPVVSAHQDSVNIRGWLEGNHDQIALVKQLIEDTIHQRWHNFSWKFPPEQLTGHWYALYGAHIGTASVDWFHEQLRQFATLAPASADNQLRGLFIATSSKGETIQWHVKNRQVHTVPGDPRHDQLDT
jgi:hypothetical protein